MELRHIRYFVAVAEELNFSRAAEKLNIAQPPLSQQINHLESELGVTLFLRTKRKVTLTYAGQVFLENAYKLFVNVEKMVEQTQNAHKGEIGSVVLGFTGIAIYDIIPRLVQCYRKKYPLVDLKVRYLSSSDQVADLLSCEIDVGILCVPVEAPELNFELIRQEPFIVALHSTHPLAKKRSVDVQELSAEPFIMTPRRAGSAFYDVIISICHNAGFSPNIVQEVLELNTALALVSFGIGITLLPQSHQNLHIDHVVYRKLTNQYPPLATALAWRKNESSPTVNTLISLAKDFPSFL